MAQTMTVQGTIEAERLGFTSMHEHALYDGAVYFKRTEGKFPEDLPVKADDPVRLENIDLLQRNFTLSKVTCSMRDEEWMAAELAEFKESGGQTLADQSPPGLRSDVLTIQRISKRTGVHIITTTSLYTEASWPDQFKGMSRDEYAMYMLNEIENGIGGSDVKPGAIKIAGLDLTGQQEKVLRAAGCAANESGLMLTVHPGFDIGNDGRRIVKILREEDVNLERVVIAYGDGFVSTNLKT